MNRVHLANSAERGNDLSQVQIAPKPLLRGWLHAAAFLTATLFTILLLVRSAYDPARQLSLLIFGLSTMELYGVSALYHIGPWSPPIKSTLRAIDHANIFVLIAGTYTPICFNVLSGGMRIGMLITVWMIAMGGIISAIFTARLPRWLAPVLYVGMGWVAIIAIPTFLTLLPWIVTALLALGGIWYTIGAAIYARKWPNPWPKVFGFHEVFHLMTVLGGLTFAAIIWFWIVPFPRL